MTKGILKFLVSIQILEGGDLYQPLQCLRGSVLVAVDVRPWILGLSDFPWPSSWLTRKVVVHHMICPSWKGKISHRSWSTGVFFLRNQQTIVLQLLFICLFIDKLRSQVLYFLYSRLKTNNIWNPKSHEGLEDESPFRFGVIFRWTIWVFQDLCLVSTRATSNLVQF